MADFTSSFSTTTFKTPHSYGQEEGCRTKEQPYTPFFNKGEHFAHKDTPLMTDRNVNSYSSDQPTFMDTKTGKTYTSKEALLKDREQQSHSKADYPKPNQRFDDPETGETFSSKAELKAARERRANAGRQKQKTEMPQADRHTYNVDSPAGSTPYWNDVVNCVKQDHQQGETCQTIAERLNRLFDRTDNISFKVDPSKFDVNHFLATIKSEIFIFARV